MSYEGKRGAMIAILIHRITWWGGRKRWDAALNSSKYR